MNLGKLGEMVRDREAWRAAEQVCRILFWQKENIVGLRPPETEDHGPAGRRVYVSVCLQSQLLYSVPEAF